MKSKAMFRLAFVSVAALMVVAAIPAAIAQTVQSPNPSGPTPVNPAP